MNLQEQIIKDVALITSNSGGFNTVVNFTAPNSQTASIYCPVNKIGHALNTDLGVIVNTKNATVVFSESILLANNPNYPVRDSSGEVAMIGHLISCKDSTGTLCNYCVGENIPDESVGLITLKLKDYEA